MKFLVPILSLVWATCVCAMETQILYLKSLHPAPPVLSNLDPIPENLGVAGASLGIADNNTTGQFLNQTYILNEISIEPNTVGTAKAEILAADYIITDLTSDELSDLTALIDGSDTIVFNATNQSDALRSNYCHKNILHTIPSYAMRADALSQAMVKKRWTDWAMIYGTYPKDAQFADAIRKSAKKFKIRLRGELEWDQDADIRRSASSELPIFTQPLKDHDVLIVIDEINDFSRYVEYNTWLPRPVAGSHGLRPLAWDRTVEQWGAAQLQSRFNDLHQRSMKSEDYAAWAAVRAIGEAVTRTNQNAPSDVKSYMLSDKFALAAFKGRPLSFRSWNGQMRQPIPVVASGALVSQAPVEGFLHERNELDSLGLDKRESKCEAFGG